jgi:hypothetical protein
MSYALDDIEPDKMFTGGYTPIKEGFYHAMLDDGFDVEKPGKGISTAMVWKLIGVPANDKEAAAFIGRTVKEYLADWTPLFPKQFIRIGMAIGEYSPQFISELKASGKRIERPNFADWIGKTCVVRVKNEPGFTDKTKVYAKIGWDYYPIDSEEAKASGVVINHGYVKELPPENDTPF